MSVGRISSSGFIPSEPYLSKIRDTVSFSSVPLPPEEVLFRRRCAPGRYEEYDIYWADRDLEVRQTLPESDLLKAIHTYSSCFYGRATQQMGAADFESLDETALLCMGFLLEETAESILGTTGDLAFVEGEDVELAEDTQAQASSPNGSNNGESATQTLPTSLEKVSDADERGKRKRRKIREDDSNAQARAKFQASTNAGAP